MEGQELILKLEKYLKRTEASYYEDSISYKGLRQDVPQKDGNLKDMLMVSYLVSINKDEYDSDATYYAYFDSQNKKLLYIIGLQFYELIEE